MIEGVQIRIRDILYTFKKRWGFVLLCTAVGLMLGIGLIGITTIRNGGRNYTIKTSVAVTTKSSNGYLMGASNMSKDDYYLTQDMVSAVNYLMKSDAVMNAAIKDSKINGLTPNDIKDHLTLTQYNKTQIMEIKLYWKNDKQGLALVDAIVKETNNKMPETLQLGGLSTINESSAVYNGEYTIASYSGLFLGVFGFMAGILCLILDLLMRPKLLNAGDVEEALELETIGVIQQKDKAFLSRRSLLDEGVIPGEILQNYMSSSYILDNLLGKREAHKCFYVTSTHDGEGKSLTAAALAICCAKRGKKVLLVDLDVKNPSLGSLFLERVDYSRSLNALQQGESDNAKVELAKNLTLMPLILEHHMMAVDDTIFNYIEEEKKNYDYIILDAAPIGERSDVLALSQIATACLFVIRYDFALLSNVQLAIEKLDKAGIRVLGALVNGYRGLDTKEKEDVPVVHKPVQKGKKDLLEAADEEFFEEEDVRSVLSDLDDTEDEIYEESSDEEIDAILGTEEGEEE